MFWRIKLKILQCYQMLLQVVRAFGSIIQYIFLVVVIMQFKPKENIVEILPIKIPIGFGQGTSLTDGKFIYLFDGFFEVQAKIVKFDPIIQNFTIYTVTNLSGTSGSAAVYVAKMNRIYIFGGQINETAATDKIDYIHME